MFKDELPTFESLPINVFSNVFGDTTNSYKLYWAYALLDVLKQDGFKSEIDIKDVTIRMVALAWYPVSVFKLSLGKQDQIGKTVQTIAGKIMTKDDDKPIIISNKIKDLCAVDKEIDKLINDLTRYVPYRFIAPFFASELLGIVDGEKNRLIAQLSVDSFLKENPSIYKISSSKGIVLHPVWLDYFKRHLSIIESYMFWHLMKYINSRNPNVQNIISKIQPPQKRELKEAKEFWRIVLNLKEIYCIYSGCKLNIENQISIDHFVPWSYVAHDYLWNLLPTIMSVNSSKSNNLPKLDLYLSKFSALQFEAFNLVFKTSKTKFLEDYVLLYQDSLVNISSLSESDFRLKLEKQILPLTEIASNMGFNSNWVFSY